MVVLTRLDIPVRVSSLLPRRNTILTPRHLAVHQRLLCFVAILLFIITSLPPVIILYLLRSFSIRVGRLFPHSPCVLLTPLPARGTLHPILMHRLQSSANAQEENHQSSFGKIRVVNEVRVDHVLQIAAPVVREEYVYGLGARIRFVAYDAVVDTVYDIWVWREESVCFNLLHRLRNRFLPEGTSYLLQREQLM